MIRTRNLVAPKQKYLWKYIDLYKFLDLIRSKQLFFNSLDQFDDILEGMSEKEANEISTASSIASIAMINRNRKLPLWAYNSRATYVVSIYNNQKKYQQDYFVNCFYNSMYESAAMWSLYSGLDGIALKFDAEYLYQFIKSYHSTYLKAEFILLAKNLVYKNLLNIEIYDKNNEIKTLDNTKSPFNKDRLYQHEKEYRFIFKKNSDSAKIPSVDISDFDFSNVQIFVPTHIPEWKYNLINSILKEYKLNIEITKSSILTKRELTKYKDIYLDYHIKKP